MLDYSRIFGLFKNNSFPLSFPLITTKHSRNKLWKISLNIHDNFVFIQDLTFSPFVRLYNFVLTLVSPCTFHIHSIHGRRRIEQVSCPRHLFKQKLLPRFFCSIFSFLHLVNIKRFSLKPQFVTIIIAFMCYNDLTCFLEHDS